MIKELVTMIKELVRIIKELKMPSSPFCAYFLLITKFVIEGPHIGILI